MLDMKLIRQRILPHTLVMSSLRVLSFDIVQIGLIIRNMSSK